MTDRSARATLADLVAFPTVAGTPNRALVDLVAERIAGLGAAVEISTGARSDAHNLHAVLGPADAPGLVLSGHTDVVAVDGQPWSSDPFLLCERRGRLYGRGSADMKGFLAAALAALDDVRPRALCRPVHVVLSSDEELGCLGIRPLLGRLAGGVAPGSLTIVGEPTSLQVVERHKGKLALEVTVRGRAAHSSRPGDGINAVEYGARFVGAMLTVAEELREKPSHPGFAVPHSTVSTGPIRGGTTLNIVPDRCTVELEVRLVPGADPAAVRSRIAAVAGVLAEEMRARDPDTGIDLRTLAEYPALAGGANREAVMEIAELAGTQAGGAVDFGTEAGLLHAAIGGTVLVCGPGDMAQAHRHDEYIERAQLDAAERFLGRLLATLTRP